MHVTDNARLSEAMIPVPLRELEAIRAHAEWMTVKVDDIAVLALSAKIIEAVNKIIRGAK